MLDKELYALREEKNILPEEIKKKEAFFEEKKRALAAVEQQYADLLKQKKDEELQLGSKEENIRKLQSQLHSLKTNKEYAAMLHEIEAAKADKSSFEDKILNLLEQMDAVKEPEAGKGETCKRRKSLQ